MIYEITSLIYLQAAQLLLSSDSATLCWDATSLAADHVNEVHLEIAGNKSLTLSIAILPGGRAVDCTLHMTQTIDRMAKVYSAFANQDAITVKKEIIRIIKSTKSNRAPVNCPVVRELGRQ